MNNRYDCQECGQNVTVVQRHTYDHCLAQLLLNESYNYAPNSSKRLKMLHARDRLLALANEKVSA